MDKTFREMRKLEKWQTSATVLSPPQGWTNHYAGRHDWEKLWKGGFVDVLVGLGGNRKLLQPNFG